MPYFKNLSLSRILHRRSTQEVSNNPENNPPTSVQPQPQQSTTSDGSRAHYAQKQPSDPRLIKARSKQAESAKSVSSSTKAVASTHQTDTESQKAYWTYSLKESALAQLTAKEPDATHCATALMTLKDLRDEGALDLEQRDEVIQNLKAFLSRTDVAEESDLRKNAKQLLDHFLPTTDHLGSPISMLPEDKLLPIAAAVLERGGKTSKSNRDDFYNLRLVNKNFARHIKPLLEQAHAQEIVNHIPHITRLTDFKTTLGKIRKLSTSAKPDLPSAFSANEEPEFLPGTLLQPERPETAPKEEQSYQSNALCELVKHLPSWHTETEKSALGQPFENNEGFNEGVMTAYVHRETNSAFFDTLNSFLETEKVFPPGQKEPIFAELIKAAPTFLQGEFIETQIETLEKLKTLIGKARSDLQPKLHKEFAAVLFGRNARGNHLVTASDEKTALIHEWQQQVQDTFTDLVKKLQKAQTEHEHERATHLHAAISCLPFLAKEEQQLKCSQLLKTHGQGLSTESLASLIKHMGQMVVEANLENKDTLLTEYIGMCGDGFPAAQKCDVLVSLHSLFTEESDRDNTANRALALMSNLPTKTQVPLIKHLGQKAADREDRDVLLDTYIGRCRVGFPAAQECDVLVSLHSLFIDPSKKNSAVLRIRELMPTLPSEIQVPLHHTDGEERR